MYALIAVGFLMSDSTAAVAKKYPKTKFAIVDVDQAVLVRGVAQHRVGQPFPGSHRVTVAARLPIMSQSKWEYLTAPVLVHATKQILDNFGQDGWELVQIVPGMNPENLVAYFKRPLA